ncbi:MAG TPA: acyl-CoA thioesterase [Pseudonocardiaceae bacterium]
MEEYFELKHMVGLEETNFVGNVYYVNYLKWQGRCREMFLSQYAPDVLQDMRGDLSLYTLKAECEFLSEITAYDQLVIRMRVEDLTQSQIGFRFDYVRVREGYEDLIARGRQRFACMRGTADKARPTRVPESLRKALSRFVITPAPSARPKLELVTANEG